MFSTIRTKLSDFHHNHPVWDNVLFLLFILAFGYAMLSFLVCLPTLVPELSSLLKNAGISLAGKPYGFGLVFGTLVLLFVRWAASFKKSLKEKDWGVHTIALFLLAVPIMMSTNVISQFPDLKFLAIVVGWVGYVLVGFAVTRFSTQGWDMAKKANIAMKPAYYFASIGFPIMYLLAFCAAMSILLK